MSTYSLSCILEISHTVRIYLKKKKNSSSLTGSFTGLIPVLFEEDERKQNVYTIQKKNEMTIKTMCDLVIQFSALLSMPLGLTIFILCLLTFI